MCAVARFLKPKQEYTIRRVSQSSNLQTGKQRKKQNENKRQTNEKAEIIDIKHAKNLVQFGWFINFFCLIIFFIAVAVASK